MTDDMQPQSALEPPSDVDAAVGYVLDRYRVFAVVGASPRPWRPSHGVMRTLIRHGFEVVPVNPTCDEILGRTCYPDLQSVPTSVGVEVVDIFRRSEHAGRHVDEAIETGAAAVWMQLGVIDEDAARRARAAGLAVVMDRCPAIELGRRR